MTPTLSWSDLSRSGGKRAEFPAHLPDTRKRYTYNGSAAIHAALQDYELAQGASVLLPAYCCGAELGPFERLACHMVFYDVEPDFSVNAEKIGQILKAQPQIRLMLLTHYLGLAQPELKAIADQCRRHEVCLVEDCAHALYTELHGRPVGQSGDYAIFSMRKSLPLSEGGALVARQALKSSPAEQWLSPSFIARLGRLAYSFQQGARSGGKAGSGDLRRLLTVALWVLPAMVVKVVRVTGLVPASRWLTPDVEGEDAYPVYPLGISGFSRRLLERADGRRVREQRRANHALWLEQVAAIPGVDAVHRELPKGACPLYFLVRVSDPGACVKRLADRDVEAFNWWQHLSPGIQWSEYPIARQFKQTLLALPLHQGLTDEDIIHMAHCLSIVAVSESS